jgi:hypothetical protein
MGTLNLVGRWNRLMRHQGGGRCYRRNEIWPVLGVSGELGPAVPLQRSAANY